MCGIIGYNGTEAAEAVLLGGLERLEYRGYDSAGAAVLAGGKFSVRRAVGPVAALRRALAGDPLPPSGLGIAHTRWATHGAPTVVNAHPHTWGRVSLVHNGIIENYGELRAELEAGGHVFASDTDTEVIVRLLDGAYRGDPLAAIRQVLPRLSGSYALAILFSDREELYGVRCGSPLLAGLGDGVGILASDRPALLPLACQFTPLREGDVVCLRRGEAVFYDGTGKEVSRPLRPVGEAEDGTDKGDYRHYMEKEMAEQPEAVRRTLGPYLQTSEPFGDRLPNGRQIRRILFLACGSAMHACLSGKRMMEAEAGIPCEVQAASEMRYGVLLPVEGTLAVAVSQSGETADTLAALRLCREQGIPTVGVVNVPTSTLAAEADTVLLTRAGTEVAVATTKAYTVQVAVLGLMAYRFARDRGLSPTLSPSDFRALPEAIARVLALDEACLSMAGELMGAQDVFYIGRGRDLPVCMEGALKLKEISYLHAEAYPAGELKHGTISLLEPGTPVVALATDSRLLPKTVSNARECRARGAKVLFLAAEGLGELPADACDRCLTLPALPGELAVLPAAVAMQGIAYHTARLLGRPIDRPRNLAKSVTVE